MKHKEPSVDVSLNLLYLLNMIEFHNLDAMIISDTDLYLNEYVPLHEAHYYHFSSFTGSTCQILVTASHGAYIFVDGRYHEQADNEIDTDLYNIVKCTQSQSIHEALIQKMGELNLNRIGLDGLRSSRGFEEKLEVHFDLYYFDQNEFATFLPVFQERLLQPIKKLDLNVCGQTSVEKISHLLAEGELYYITGLDSIAWLTNARGFHLPYQSVFLAKCLASRNKIHLFNVENQDVENPFAEGLIEFEKVEIQNLFTCLSKYRNEHRPHTVWFNKNRVSGAEYRKLSQVFGLEVLKHTQAIELVQSQKNDQEIEVITDSYRRSALAVAETIRWAKKQVRDGIRLTEKDFYQRSIQAYKAQGCIDQSFHTIASIGSNTSIIHYSGASENVVAKDGDMLLLDSGALYAAGYATDITRTFMVGSSVNPENRKIYTICLKGLISALTAIVPEGAVSASIDILARSVINKKGYDYMHGTGHGIGINVHESIARFSSRATAAILENQVLSVEPGIYIPGFGGVRHENAVVIKKHLTMAGMMYLHELVYVGFDEELIDRSLLSQDEADFLDAYQLECGKRGTLIS